LTMLLGGLWHGASWNFVIWGGLHGAALVVHKRATELWRGSAPSRLRASLGWVFTFHFVLFCWIFFRAPDLATVKLVLSQLSTVLEGLPHLGTVLVARRDVIFAAVADEEAGGMFGAQALVRSHPHWFADAAGRPAAAALNEVGGYSMTVRGRRFYTVQVAEKGIVWARLRTTGVPGHGSMPLRTDSALLKAAEAVRRLVDHRPPARMHEVWQGFVEGLDLGDELRSALLDPDSLERFCQDADELGLARVVHACTHTTLAPTMLDAGVKINVIPDHATLALDVRALPGDEEATIVELIGDALGDLKESVEVDFVKADPATTSPRDTPMWDVLQRHAERLVPGARNVPALLPAATDSRFLRRLGATCYGYGLYSDRIPFDEFTRMFHGENERIDQESLRLSTELWLAVAQDLLTA
ncbi:MAG: M20/M25/M40 family metallo-hydrolase, partial [Actinobacteria bacterium]|nr:M20/M25/M40 family metallo-hydrolase [Actinomycetota bacterium]